jgi:putative membrane protein
MKSANPIMVAYNNCWRILRTPMPFAYLAHLRAFLCLWLALLPWVFTASYGWYSMILCGFICWGILGVEEAAVEVEQPFGRDSNDLPLDCIARDTFHLIFEFIINSGFDDQGRALSTSLSIAPAKGNEMV